MQRTTRSRRPTPRAALTVAAILLALSLGCSPGSGEASASMRIPGDGQEESTAIRSDTSESTLASAESRIDDAILHFEVKAKLLDALHWDAIGIDIDALDGNVLLSGEVPTRSARELAEEVARSVEGVEQVESRLVLESDEKEETPRETLKDRVSEAEREVRDALLESRLKARLLQEMGRHALDIEVEAADGVVTLRGHLDNEAHEQIALETASKTPGVEEVVNLLET